MKAKFITFEGGEGVGKSTQIQLLFNHLNSLGFPVIITREPGGCISAEKIRSLFVGEQFDPLTQTHLIMAARREHYIHTLKPHIEKGFWVLCDRFIDSTLVYQGLKGISSDQILNLHNSVCEGLMPDITFLMDLDVNKSLERLSKRIDQNVFDQDSFQIHEQRRNFYLSLLEKNPKRIHKINAEGEALEIFQEILKFLSL